jgi:outer membrane receptor protein involved in Fe transport
MLTAPALAASAPDNGQVETIIVTAQKRSEDIQNVPISIQALGTEKLEQLHIASFNDYVKFFPSVTYTSGGAGGGNAGPGFANISMRGIVSGNDGNHSGPLPTVGVYLDEQPITTIGGTLDMHVYDIDHVEVLSGPQGTLYGASSEAGTIRIITNKPDTSGFSASYDVQANTVAHGGEGYTAEGYVNVPLSSNTAVRIVAWSEHDAGYIDNVASSRTYPGNQSVGGSVPPITINDYPFVKKNFNSVDTYGARAALKIDLNDQWSITPSLMAQWENSYGIFAYDPQVGDLKVKQYNPDFVHQNWVQAALTVQGKVGDLDLTYSGGHMDWWIRGESDYADYSYWYDKLFPSSFPQYFYDNHNNPIAPTQTIFEGDHFIKDSHEFRIASPSTDRLRFVTGAFFERQQHWILQNYSIQNLALSESVTGWPGTIWLTDQERIDQDAAIFGDVSYDILPNLTLTGGLRLYDYRNTLAGFYGFNSTFSSHSGEAHCYLGPNGLYDSSSVPGSVYQPGMFHNAPCTNLDYRAVGTGNTHKINLTYKVDDDRMVYFTWSTGFRPGGINRRTDDAGPYAPDKLTNFEVGWKTSWLGNTLRINGALFREDWDNVQFPFLGANSFTIIQNAGNATSQGLESDFEWRPISALTFSGAFAVTDAQLNTDYCGFNNPVTKLPITGNCLAQDGFPPQAPAGTQLPITPKYKGNLTTRYDFPVGGNMTAHLQGSVQAQSSSWADLRVTGAYPLLTPPTTAVPIRSALGRQEGYASFDFSAGIDTDAWSLELYVENAFDERAQQYRYAECVTQVCDNQTYIVPSRPRLIGLKFGQRF